MGTLTIAGSSYSDIITGCHEENVYYLIAPMGNDPVETAPIYEEQHVSYPGVDGMGIKRFGFRGRVISVEMAFLSTSKTNCETQKNDFHTAITALPSFGVCLPGGTTRAKCRLQSSSPIGWRQWGVEQLMLVVKYDFLQVREA